MGHDLVYILLKIFTLWTSILLTLMILGGIIAGAYVTLSRFDTWLVHNYKPYEPFVMIGVVLGGASLIVAILVTLTDWKERY